MVLSSIHPISVCLPILVHRKPVKRDITITKNNFSDGCVKFPYIIVYELIVCAETIKIYLSYFIILNYI